jgi:hypothetical protein
VVRFAPGLFLWSISFSFFTEFFAFNFWAKGKKFLKKEKDMLFHNTLKNIVKVTSSKLEQVQKMLVQLDFSLDEIMNYDNGAHYQSWSNPSSGQHVLLDIQEDSQTDLDNVIEEIIDCWHELREIKNVLSDDYETIPSGQPDPLPHDQLCADIQEWESDMSDENDSLHLIFNGKIDTALLCFYNLDEDTRLALLQ